MPGGRKAKTRLLGGFSEEVVPGLSAVLCASELFSMLKLFLAICQDHLTDHQ
jgi:hypothetical protein